MGKKARKIKSEFDTGPYDGFDDFFDEDPNLEDLSRDIYSTEWTDGSKKKRRGEARRKIEHLGDMKKLYSELNDWEEFGEHDSWRIH